MNDEQRDNRLRLADGLCKVWEEWPEHFDMSYFIGDKDTPATSAQFFRHLAGEHPMTCGTVACALGWAPYLLGEPRTELHWGDYAERVLGMDYGEYDDLFTLWNPDETHDPRPVAARLRASVHDTEVL